MRSRSCTLLCIFAVAWTWCPHADCTVALCTRLTPVLLQFTQIAAAAALLRPEGGREPGGEIRLQPAPQRIQLHHRGSRVRLGGGWGASEQLKCSDGESVGIFLARLFAPAGIPSPAKTTAQSYRRTRHALLWEGV